MNHIKAFITAALNEDIGRGDLYAQIATDCHAKAYIVAKECGIFSGEVYLKALLEHFKLRLNHCIKDSKAFKANDKLCEFEGSHIAILQMERVALNIIAHSSGIATLTNKYIKALSDTTIQILDTRKSRPLLRALEKYSVRNGGGHNHRFGLDTMLMLKDTHLAHISNLQAIISKAREQLPFGTPIEVECENLAQVESAISANVDIIMCDNMHIDDIKTAVALRNANAPHIIIEASGNINLQNINTYAQSGLNAISIGALIHQAKWLDLSLKIDKS